MARVSQTSQQVVLAGLAASMTAPTVDGDIIDVGRVWLLVTNGSGSSITVTVETPGVVDGDLAIADRVVSVAASATKVIPITSVQYKQTVESAVAPADVNRAYVDYSAVGSVTRAVLSL